MATNKRPLSPFMIGPYYKPQMTSMLSITHRITGVFLSLGLLWLTYWLLAAAAGPEAFAEAQHRIGSILGQLFLFMWTLSLFFHLAHGLRHLAWDMGYGFDIPTTYKTGKAAIAFAIVMTLLVWLIAGT